MNCQYKDMFGKVDEGVHSYRVFNIAIVDVLATVVGAYIISYVTNKSFIGILIALFILGVLMHHIFCVQTTVDKLLFN
jgi:hypothetical protein